jgi:UDP-glucose 4-epimerase
MSNQQVILVTGGELLGAQLPPLISAASSETGYHVIGLDSEPPDESLKGLDFIQADIRNPLFVDLLKSEKVHTVCHLVFAESVRASEAVFDVNVMGTMKVLGACAEAGVRKVVLKSSMSIYGANPGNPSFITEQQTPQTGRTYGTTRNLVEIGILQWFSS